MLRLLKVIPETILDGEGIRYAIYLAGCKHDCPGCHNPDSHDPNMGTPITAELVEHLVDDIMSNSLLDGITFSGGDPFYNPSEFLPLIKTLKERTQLNIWCYTGYTLEELLADTERAPILQYIDVLVDGRFVSALYDPRLSFVGSSNQRILVIGD